MCAFCMSGGNCYLFFIVEATFTQIPVNTSALLGTTAQFNCTADGVAGVTYLVNSMTVINVASIGVTQSIVYSGSQIIAYLYVPVTKDTNNYSVVCFACLLDVTCVYSPPAYLKGQGSLFLCVFRIYKWYKSTFCTSLQKRSNAIL